jgi:carboxyl-terminal processing protease
MHRVKRGGLNMNSLGKLVHSRSAWSRGALAASALVMVLLAQVGSARAADGSLVVAALQVLERNYAEPVHPVDLLNAALAIVRTATHESAAILPDIPSADTEQEADAAFLTEFSHAAQADPQAETKLAYAATQGMLDSLHDTHTYFLNPSQFAASRQELTGASAFTGIGIRITGRADGASVHWIFVEAVVPGSPAEAAGIQRFDRIVQAGATSLRNATPAEASQAVRGPAGTTVALTVLRGQQTLRMSVVRAPIQSGAVEARFIQSGIAYVRLFQFSQGAGRDLNAALQDLATQAPLRAVILDLRGNPGGLIIEAARVGSLFLPPGTTLANVTDRQDGPGVLTTRGVGPFAQVPLTVLVDAGSASGAEIVTGALRDYHRATIVGEKTVGALGGAVEVPLPEGGMSVTVERITTPRGAQVEGVGISPDVLVTLTEADMERGVDTQLQAALQAAEAPSHAASGLVEKSLDTQNDFR